MIKEYEQILEILDSVKVIQEMLKNNKSQDKQLINDLSEAMKEINSVVFGCDEISTNKAVQFALLVIEDEIEVKSFLPEVESWRELISKTLQKRSSLKNDADRKFYKLMDYIGVLDIDKLMEYAIENIKEIRNANEKVYKDYEAYYTYFERFWGGLNLDTGDYSVIEQRVNALKEHHGDFIWLYNKLGDYRSKSVLYGILFNWLYFDHSILLNIKEYHFDDYYDLDLIDCDENEVLVDIGAFIGDSAKSFIDNYGNYKRVYCYEITEESIEKCKNLLSDYQDVIIYKKGVGSKNETKYFNKLGLDGSANMVKEQGEIPVDIVSIDNDISEKITLIKMDIEGAEQDAIKGCKRHIAEEHPKLAICTYHNNEDIWKIPRMIDEIDPNYKYYMRYNGDQIGPTEYVLIAL